MKENVRQKEKEKKEKKKEKTEIIIKILGQCLSCPHLHLMTFFHWTHSHKFIYQLATVRKQKQSHFNDITRVLLDMKTSFSYSLHLSSSLQMYLCTSGTATKRSITQRLRHKT